MHRAPTPRPSSQSWRSPELPIAMATTPSLKQQIPELHGEQRSRMTDSQHHQSEIRIAAQADRR